MRLLIISAGALPLPVTQGGAVETLTEYLIKENENHHDFDITVISIYDKNSEIKSKDYKFCRFIYIRRSEYLVKYLSLFRVIMNKIFKINVSSRIDYIYKFKKRLKNEQYEKILIENDSHYVNIVKKYQKGEIYLHLHNDYLNIDTQNAVSIYNSCKKIITVSQYIQKCVLSVPGSSMVKVRVLKNCTNTAIFNRDLYRDERKKLREKLGISEEDIVFLFSGRISKTKGIKELCRALQNLNIDNVKLLIIGSAWYGSNDKDKFVKELEKITQSESNRIIFTGYVSRDIVPKYHAISDVAVIPSVWEEPAGLVVIEAISSGLPLIVTNSGGIPEFINDEIAIMVDKDKDLIDLLTMAMKKMIENPNLKNLMGKKAKEWGKQYNIEQYYSDFVTIIKEKGEN